MTPTEKPKRVITESEQMSPKHKSKADRDLYLESEDSEVEVDAVVAPKRVDKGKGKATDLSNSLNEAPAPKVCYAIIAQ